MAAPTLSVLKIRSGTPQVFPLLTGTTLGAQDGSDFGAAEGGVATLYRTGNRIIEAFGKRFAQVHDDIYERDEGGAGTWGSVHSRTGGVGGSGDGASQSGIHLLHPGGVPTLASFYFNAGTGQIWLTTSTDGVSWSDLNLGVGTGGGHYSGHSIAFRDSLFWFHITTGIEIIERNLSTNITTTYNLSQMTSGSRLAAFAIVDNELYLCCTALMASPTDLFTVLRLFGGSWQTIATLPSIQIGNTGAQNGGCCGWADGSDLIVFAGGENISGGADGDSFFRITDPAGTATVTDISSSLLTAGNSGDIYLKGGGSGVMTATWDVIVDNNTTPGQAPGIYLWRYPGPGQAGTRTAWTYNYRQISHGAVTGTFSVNEIVTGTTSGATAKIAAVNGGSLSLTNVDETGGAFQSGEPLTTTGGSATSSSVLTEQPFTADGLSIGAEFALPHTVDGIGNRIPTKPAARAEIGDASNPPEETAAGTKYYFRVYGTGAVGVITIYLSTDEEAPDAIATLTGSVVIESGSPATTPTRSGNTITNVTPDSGVALYSFVHDVTADGLVVGDTFGLTPKIV
jgi:hypothetical protein